MPIFDSARRNFPRSSLQSFRCFVLTVGRPLLTLGAEDAGAASSSAGSNVVPPLMATLRLLALPLRFFSSAASCNFAGALATASASIRRTSFRSTASTISGVEFVKTRVARFVDLVDAPTECAAFSSVISPMGPRAHFGRRLQELSRDHRQLLGFHVSPVDVRRLDERDERRAVHLAVVLDVLRIDADHLHAAYRHRPSRITSPNLTMGCCSPCA